MYYVVDTFNKPMDYKAVGQLISAHRTLDAAEKGAAKFGRAVARANGPGSYIPTAIVSSEEARIVDGCGWDRRLVYDR